MRMRMRMRMRIATAPAVALAAEKTRRIATRTTKGRVENAPIAAATSALKLVLRLEKPRAGAIELLEREAGPGRRRSPAIPVSSGRGNRAVQPVIPGERPKPLQGGLMGLPYLAVATQGGRRQRSSGYWQPWKGGRSPPHLRV